VPQISFKFHSNTANTEGHIVPYKEIGVKESNGDVRILTGSSQIAISAHAQWKYG